MNTRILFVSSVVVLTLFAQCQTGTKDQSTATADTVADASATPPADITVTAVSAPQFTVDQAFQQQLGTLFKNYVALKEAFVATDAAQVKATIKPVADALGQVDMKLITGAAHHDWMTYQSALQQAVQEIQNASDIEVQRKAFSTLSDNLYKTVKAFGLGGATAYYEFCPMAFNDQGAHWLSDNAAIRNPYFGDKMLTCGMVKETLK